MKQQLQYNNLTWYNIEKPDKKDWEFLEKELQAPTEMLLEMTESFQQPHITEYVTKQGKNLYLHLTIPLFNRAKRTTENGDLYILLNDKSLTTIVFKKNLPLKSIYHHAEKSERFRRELFGESSGEFLIRFLIELTSLSFEKIRHINENIDWVKETIFEENSENNVREISRIKLDILMFRRILKPHKNIFETMLQEKFQLLDNQTCFSLLHQLLRINVRVWNNIESAQEIIESLEVTNNSIVSFRLNSTMRFLAAVSLITFAMSVTLGVFTLMPPQLFGAAHDWVKFILAIFSLLFILIASYNIFRRKGWL